MSERGQNVSTLSTKCIFYYNDEATKIIQNQENKKQFKYNKITLCLKLIKYEI